MKFDQFFTLRALEALEVFEGSSSKLTDHILETDGNDEFKQGFKTVCAPISQPLFDDLDAFCGLIGVSKRRFIELAICESLDRAKSLAAETGLFDELERQAQKQAAAKESRNADA